MMGLVWFGFKFRLLVTCSEPSLPSDEVSEVRMLVTLCSVEILVVVAAAVYIAVAVPIIAFWFFL